MVDKGKSKKKSGAQRRREKAAAAAAEQPAFRVSRRETMQLPCKLTQDETVTRAVSLASTLNEIRAEPARAEELKARLKAEAAALEKRRDELALVVSRGEEVRDVIVEDRVDDVAGKVRRVRTDTGDVLAERDMTAEERQVPMPLKIVEFTPPAAEPAAEPAAGPADDTHDDGGGESPETEE